MYVVMIFFNEAHTDYLVSGPFTYRKDAETEVEVCKHLYNVRTAIEIAPIAFKTASPLTIGKVS